MVKRVYIILCISALCACVWADDKKPDLQIADNTFFDPTKKAEEESYQFAMEYRLEAGYVQHEQRTRNLSYPHTYLHGGRIGATFTFLLPIHFSLQTGLLYTLTCGHNEQHWRSVTAETVRKEILNHTILEHNLTIPVRMYYTIPLWRKLNLFFYTGPQLHVCLSEYDYIDKNMSLEAVSWAREQGVRTESYDRAIDEICRANIQWGLGGGLEWDRYRLQSGYDFGLNNLAHSTLWQKRYMSEWGWMVTFSYRLVLVR